MRATAIEIHGAAAIGQIVDVMENDMRVRIAGRPTRMTEGVLETHAAKMEETCPECAGRGWVWEAASDEPEMAPCPRCAMNQQRTRGEGEGNAAQG
jgi:Zn finger protein HypA/HybF involved in hydrogenase expression